MTDSGKSSVLVIGLGLIGSSLAKALRLQGNHVVYGFDHQENVHQQALDLGVIDHAVADLSRPPNIDVIVIAVPVMAVPSVLERLKPLIPSLKAMTDVGSVKGAVVEAVQKTLGELPECFVPGHPIAGAEKSGVTAVNPELFENHMVILTPLPSSKAESVELISSMWESCGADVVQMDVARHDEVLAATSHLPHLLAFSLVDTLARESENREIFKYAAGGFRDFSRIAASDPTMWHDVFLSNRDATLKILRRFQADLSQLENAIERNDGDLLLTVFRRAKSARDFFTEILSKRRQKSK